MLSIVNTLSTDTKLRDRIEKDFNCEASKFEATELTWLKSQGLSRIDTVVSYLVLSIVEAVTRLIGSV